MMRLDLNTSAAAIEFRGRFGCRLLEVLEGSTITGRIALCLDNRTLHHSCIIKRWAIEIRNLYWDHSLKLLCMMAKRGMYTWARGLNCIKIKSDIILLILLHLTLCTHLIYFRDIPCLRGLLNKLSSILFTWLLCHQGCRSYQSLLEMLLRIQHRAFNFSVT